MNPTMSRPEYKRLIHAHNTLVAPSIIKYRQELDWSKSTEEVQSRGSLKENGLLVTYRAQGNR